MKAKLIGYTQIADGMEGLSDVQDLIAFCARVSNPANQMSTATSERLLNYLVKHAHWSPFEMASATVEIETTRDIARQILRHRSFTFQEFSQRYANPDESFGEMFEFREARVQDEKNRQNSIEVENSELSTEWYRMQQRVMWMAEKEYRAAIKAGIAKEQARALLPEGLTKSRLYMQGTIRSFIHYIQLRSANGTQKEHMDIAVAVAKAIAEIFPYAEKVISNED